MKKWIIPGVVFVVIIVTVIFNNANTRPNKEINNESQPTQNLKKEKIEDLHTNNNDQDLTEKMNLYHNELKKFINSEQYKSLTPENRKEEILTLKNSIFRNKKGGKTNEN